MLGENLLLVVKRLRSRGGVFIALRCGISLTVPLQLAGGECLVADIQKCFANDSRVERAFEVDSRCRAGQDDLGWAQKGQALTFSTQGLCCFSQTVLCRQGCIKIDHDLPGEVVIGVPRIAIGRMD